MSDMSNPIAVSDKETSLRKQIFEFQMYDSDGPYSEILQRMAKAWLEFNKAYFNDSLTSPFITVTPPGSRRALADCAEESGYGGKHQIRFLPCVIDGSYDRFNSSHAFENRWLYIVDILLHEQVHQWQHEILNIYDDGYGGHGEEFTNKVNLIGSSLGLPPVVKRRRKDKSLPISSKWPMCVRPTGYYGDLLKVDERKEPEPEDEPEPEPEQDWLTVAIQAFLKLTPDQYPALSEATGFYPMPSVVTVNDDKVDRPVEPEPKPVETKPVTKTRKVKKSKTSSPVGCLSQIEVIKALKISFSEFKNLQEQNLFPQPDMLDKNTGTGYWSDFVVENWLKNNPATSRV